MSRDDMEREQVRGLYLVGLLAILVTLKLTTSIDPLTDWVLIFVILSWAIFCFCMIFAYSNLPGIPSAPFKELAEIFLFLSLFLTVGYSILMFIILTIVFFPTTLLDSLFAFLTGVALTAIYLRLKKRSQSSENKPKP